MPLDPEEIRSILAVLREAGWAEVQVSAEGTTLVVSDVEPTHPPQVIRAPGDDIGPPVGATSRSVDGAARSVDAGELAAPAAADGESDAGTVQPAAAPDQPGGADVPITAPSLGLFWRAPKPGAPPFVEVGDEVEPDTTLCIVEVMKLMNYVKAGLRGTVAAILVDNAAMVEFGQPLFLVSPRGAP